MRFALTNHDGSRVVFGHLDGSVQVLDAERTGSIIVEWTCQVGHIKCAAFSNDGTKIVTGCAGGAI